MAKIPLLNKLKNIGQTIRTGRIPYNYKVGSPSTGKALPFDVKLSVDKDFKKTIITTAGLIGGGLAVLGIGIAIKKRRS